jgi:uncharacterized protein (UPF0276 family)
MGPRLGVGMTYVAGLEQELAEVSDLLDVIEVEPQTFWLADPRSASDANGPRFRIDHDALARVSALPQAKLLHSVSLPVGSVRPPDLDQVDLVAALCKELDAVWVSEHLAFNQAHGPAGPFVTGFFLPPRQTWAGVEAASATIRKVAARLPVRFAFETAVNYLAPRPDELPDGEFIAAVAMRADCEILLDLHNIWTNERNGRQPVATFLASLPLDRVVELHVAGGFELSGYWLDAHSGLVQPEVMQLLRDVLPRLPNVRALIFEMLPAFAQQVGVPALRHQLAELRGIWRRFARQAEPQVAASCLSMPRTSIGSDASPFVSPQEWEDTLGALAVGRSLDTPLAKELRADPGIELYRTLISEGRAGMLAGALPQTIEHLLVHMGEEGVRALLSRFAAEQEASLFGANEALAFADFLSRDEAPWPVELNAALARERDCISKLLDEQSDPR